MHLPTSLPASLANTPTQSEHPYSRQAGSGCPFLPQLPLVSARVHDLGQVPGKRSPKRPSASSMAGPWEAARFHVLSARGGSHIQCSLGWSVGTAGRNGAEWHELALGTSGRQGDLLALGRRQRLETGGASSSKGEKADVLRTSGS